MVILVTVILGLSNGHFGKTNGHFGAILWDRITVILVLTHLLNLFIYSKEIGILIPELISSILSISISPDTWIVAPTHSALIESLMNLLGN